MCSAKLIDVLSAGLGAMWTTLIKRRTTPIAHWEVNHPLLYDDLHLRRLPFALLQRVRLKAVYIWFLHNFHRLSSISETIHTEVHLEQEMWATDAMLLDTETIIITSSGDICTSSVNASFNVWNFLRIQSWLTLRFYLCLLR